MSENLFNKKISNIKGQLTFKDTNLSIESGIKIPTDEVIVAKKGSLYLCKTDGNVYKKLTDDVDLNWEEVGAGGGGSGTVSEVTATLPVNVTDGTTTPNISMTPASATDEGYVTTGAQELAGAKTFLNDVLLSADLDSSTAAPLQNRYYKCYRS